MLSMRPKGGKDIAREALRDFFFPISSFIHFLSYFFNAKARHEETISRIASEFHAQNKSYVEVKELINTFYTKLSQHEKKMLSISKDISDARRFIGRQTLYSRAFEDQDHTLANHLGLLANKTLDLKTRTLTRDQILTTAAAEIGLANIEFILKGIAQKEKAAPYLFGINKGGNFVATYLGHRMHLHSSHIIKCVYSNAEPDVYCEDLDIAGPIVLIDDVTRTGDTIVKVKDYLRDKYPDITVVSVVLVTTSLTPDMSDESTNVVDYSPWVSANPSIALPWSTASPESEIDASMYFNDLEMDQIVARVKFDN